MLLTCEESSWGNDMAVGRGRNGHVERGYVCGEVCVCWEGMCKPVQVTMVDGEIHHHLNENSSKDRASFFRLLT